MTDSVSDLLRAFDALSLSEQHRVAAEILRRYVRDQAVPDGALDEMAAELFRGFDAEEALKQPTP